MIPVHIFWSKPMMSKQVNLDTFCMMMLSAMMAKKVFGRVELMTDWKGSEFAHKLGIPYDRIYDTLEEVDQDKGFTTAKVFGYKLISETVPDYLYLDYDVFIYHHIPHHETIVQVDEGLNMSTFSIYHYCMDKGIQFPFKYRKEELKFFNMGLFKADKEVIEAYHDLYFTTLYKNQHLYTPDFYFDLYAMFLEQNLIYMVLKNQGKLDTLYEHFPNDRPKHNKYAWIDTPEEVRDQRNYVGEVVAKYGDKADHLFDEWFDTPSNFETIDQTGYIHLAHYKNNPNVVKEMLAYGFKHFPFEFANLIYEFKRIQN